MEKRYNKSGKIENKDNMKIYTPDRSKTEKQPSKGINLSKIMTRSAIAGLTLGGLILLANNPPKNSNPLNLNDSTEWYSASPNTLWDAYSGENIKKSQNAWKAYQDSVKDFGPFPDLDNDGYIAGQKVSK